MSSFTDPLKVEIEQKQREGRTLATLLEPFAYHVGAEGSGEVIVVPRFFETDFASVPQFFWRIFPPLGPWSKAAVVHDYLYATKGLSGRYSRERCDAIFWEAMGVLKVAAWKRSLMHAAVRLGGRKGFGS